MEDIEEKVAIVTGILTFCIAVISTLIPEYGVLRYTIFLGIGIITWMWWRKAWVTPDGTRI